MSALKEVFNLFRSNFQVPEVYKVAFSYEGGGGEVQIEYIEGSVVPLQHFSLIYVVRVVKNHIFGWIIEFPLVHCLLSIKRVLRLQMLGAKPQLKLVNFTFN